MIVQLERQLASSQYDAISSDHTGESSDPATSGPSVPFPDCDERPRDDLDEQSPINYWSLWGLLMEGWIRHPAEQNRIQHGD